MKILMALFVIVILVSGCGKKADVIGGDFPAEKSTNTNK